MNCFSVHLVELEHAKNNCENVTTLNNYQCNTVSEAFIKKNKPQMAKSCDHPKMARLQFGNFPYVGCWLVLSFRPFKDTFPLQGKKVSKNA